MEKIVFKFTKTDLQQFGEWLTAEKFSEEKFLEWCTQYGFVPSSDSITKHTLYEYGYWLCGDCKLSDIDSWLFSKDEQKK